MALWLHITTSWEWRGPPVGIVRVEQDLFAALARLSPEPVRYCVFVADQFFEVPPSAMVLKPRLEPPPPRKTNPVLRQARRLAVAAVNLAARHNTLAHRALGAFRARRQTEANRAKRDPAWTAAAIQPGDTVVTVGLDWTLNVDQFYTRLKRDHRARVIAFCHDLIPIRYPEFCAPYNKALMEPYFSTLFAQADALICNSDYTQSEVHKHLTALGKPAPETCVMPLGCAVPQLDSRTSLPPSLRPQGYALYVSTIERRKNHQLLYNLYAELADHPEFSKLPDLCFVGMQGWRVENLMDDILLNERVSPKIKILTNVTDAELATLYHHAQFCLFPSFVEGWGMPVAEALAMGKVVIASDAAALQEASGGAARHLSPYDGRAWRDEFLRMALDADWRHTCEQAVKASYRPPSWDDGARIVLDLVAKTAAAPATPSRP